LPTLAFPDSLHTLGELVFGSRAALFARVGLASVAFVLVATALRRTRTADTRAWGQIVASLVLIAILTTPLLAAIAVCYAVALWAAVEHAPAGLVRGTLVVALVALHVSAPILCYRWLTSYDLGVRELIAFTTNMSQLRAWAYAYDRLRRHDETIGDFRDYALYTFFFPAFVSGPLVSPGDFLRGRRATYWDDGRPSRAPEIRVALRRIAMSIVAGAGALLVAPALSETAYARAVAGGPLVAWTQALGVYFAVYLGFSAWSEANIGFAALAGVTLPENFDYAHRAYGPADYWRRWNMRLGRWMHDYVYLPLGGAHPGGRRDRLAWWNIAAVFGAVALYHHLGGLKLFGPALLAFPMFYLGWTLWAVFNTVTVIPTRRWRAPTPLGPRAVALMAATFLFESMCLQTAFAPAALGVRDLGRIYAHLMGMH
jgi:D-alanyl-lipoteichoic acid acyltransferase DltB (MBOAT superfamily)